MFQICEILIEGNIGDERIDVKDLTNDKKVVNFSIGRDIRFGDEVKTGWYKVTAWNALASFAGKLKQGDAVIIKGELISESYKDEGVPRHKMYIKASHIRKVDYMNKIH